MPASRGADPRQIVRGRIERDGQRADAGLRQRRAAARERVERGARAAATSLTRTAGPPAAPAAPRASASSPPIRQREVRRRKRLVEPRRSREARHVLGALDGGGPPRGGVTARWRRANGCRLDRASLDQPEPAVQRHVGEDLLRPRGPLDGQLHGRAGSGPGRRAAPSSAARGTRSRPARSCVRRSRSVSTVTRAPIASRLLAVPDQPDRERRAPRREVVPEHAQLRRLPRRHHREIRVAVTIEIEDGERSAVLIEVEPDRSRDVVEPAAAVVAEEHVALAAGDRSRDQQLVDRAPRIVVRRALDAGERRARHDLPPEEALEIVSPATALRAQRGALGEALARQHAVDDVEVLPSVAVEVERVGRPRPAAHLGARLDRLVLEAAVAAVAEERVAARVAPIERADLGRRVGHEGGRRGHAQAARRSTCCRYRCRADRRCRSRGRPRSSRRRDRARRPRRPRPRTSPSRPAARGCDRDSWSRSRSRRAGRATRRRRSRPTPRRSDSGRCPRRGPTPASHRRSARVRRCGRERPAGRCGHRSTAPVSPPCPRRRRRSTSRRTDTDRESRRGRSRPSRSRSTRPGAAAGSERRPATGAKRPVPSLTKSSGLVAGRQHEILVAVVVHVGEERLRRVVEHAEPRALRHVLERRSRRAPGRAGWAAPTG